MYGVNNPVTYADSDGESIILTCILVGAVIGGVAGGIAGNHIANKNEATGWDKAGYIVAGTAIGGGAGAILGWGVGALATALGGSGVASATAATSLTTASIQVEKAVEQVPTGQWHHILSNPIMRALNEHPTLSGLFDRNGSLVRAMTLDAHKGYQTWHRIIDNDMVKWITDPRNVNATAKQFWETLYKLYNTPDMINRFGQSALDYIKGMMK